MKGVIEEKVMPLEVGSIIEGKVVRITNYGAFLELPDKSLGLVHISEVDNSFVKDVSAYLHLDDVVKVKVIAVKGDGKIDLSLRQAQPKPEAGTEPPQREPVRRRSFDPSFEKMMKDFMKKSDEKHSDIKRNREAKRY